MSNTQPPMSAPVRSRWTAKDEATLQELTDRKLRIDAQNRELVDNTTNEEEWLPDWLIANATRLRALLLPFDHSGEV